jgi:hypothetical protein
MKKMMFNDRYGLTQAVISGRKTVTRRVVKDAWWPIYKIEAEEIKGDIIHVIANNGKLVIEHKCPYKIGEIVAVAQCYADIHSELMIGDFGDDCYDSFKNAVVHDKAGWHNKMFVQADLMPHRIQITDIRIERLQDISDDDCMKEGIRRAYAESILDMYGYIDYKGRGLWFDTPREAFASLIDKVSGEGTWERNPFVWRIEFKLVK